MSGGKNAKVPKSLEKNQGFPTQAFSARVPLPPDDEYLAYHLSGTKSGTLVHTRV